MDIVFAYRVLDDSVEESRLRRGASDVLPEVMRYLREAGVSRETLIWFWASLHFDHAESRWVSAGAARDRIKFLMGPKAYRGKQGRKP
jgi:hypothetical protein